MPRSDIFRKIKDDIFIKNRIQIYRLHYNYLKTCLKYPKEFKVDKSKYLGWQLNKVKSLTFDKWWGLIGRNLLGRKLEQVRQIRTTSFNPRPNSVVFEIPTDSPVEYSLQKIRELLKEKTSSSSEQRQHHIKLEIYLETWRLKRTKLTLQQVRKELIKKRKMLIEKRLGTGFVEKKGKTLAMGKDKIEKFLKFDPKRQSFNQLKNLERQVLRFKTNAQRILENVCAGEFTGKYSS